MTPQPGAAPLRRLTRFEYNNVVRDLMADTTRPADAFPPEATPSGFDNDATSLTASRILIEQYFSAATKLAPTAAAKFTCDPVRTGEQMCARQFIDDFGQRAFRRPVDDRERTLLLGVFSRDAQLDDYKTRIQTVARVILQLPQFLYRVESTGGAAPTPPSSWEMASRLSFLLWGTMPDPDLFGKAKAGTLSTPQEIAAQARMMLMDKRARDVVQRFHDFTLGFTLVEEWAKDPKVFPTFSSTTLPPLFLEETHRFLNHVIWEGGGGDFTSLMSAPFTFVNGPLATFYGISGVTGSEFRKVTPPAGHSAGFLTQASAMARLGKYNRTDPIARGLFVRRSLLCDTVPDPPPDIPATEQMLDPNLPARVRLAMHRADMACSLCHKLFDPIGFGFENFDAVGRWRDTENGQAVDATGEIAGTDVSGPFNGPTELAKKIASSPQARRCYVAKWFQYAYGRPEKAEDRCSRAQVETAFANSGQKIQELLIALTQTDAFLYRPKTAP